VLFILNNALILVPASAALCSTLNALNKLPVASLALPVSS
jgi:hypothetical protein